MVRENLGSLILTGLDLKIAVDLAHPQDINLKGNTLDQGQDQDRDLDIDRTGVDLGIGLGPALIVGTGATRDPTQGVLATRPSIIAGAGGLIPAVPCPIGAGTMGAG